MVSKDGSTGGSGRGTKRFLSPSQKYEVWLQLTRGEVTVAEAAANAQVDRTTINRIKQVAKEGALAALAASKPGVKGRTRDYELEAARAENARLSEALKEMAVRLTLGRGKRRLGLSGRVPRRVDAATKAGLLDLLDGAVDAGWSIRRAADVLELGEVRVHRWWTRRARGQLVDTRPGAAVHGILAEEEAEILALFDQWGTTDRSHRKLAHRGSYLGRVWVSPSTVRRVLHVAQSSRSSSHI